jgi:hypothetical protein
MKNHIIITALWQIFMDNGNPTGHKSWSEGT